jgi:tetratricopeptide (TPR) repeat protein
LNYLGRYAEAIGDFTEAMEFHLLPTEPRAEILLQMGIAHRENNNLEQARREWETALKCEISPELKEAINAELYPKGPPKAGTIGSFWGWARSKWTGDSKK